MAKKRIDTHLKEDASENLLRAMIPKEWVIRKLHPDYGVDVSVEVFEEQGGVIPSLGEFIFIQLKATSSLKTATVPIRVRRNVEKGPDEENGEVEFELDVIKFVVDANTIDNARLMGPSTPLMLFVCDVKDMEVYYVCLTDYYDKILEPRSLKLGAQATATIEIPVSNKLSVKHSIEVMRLYAARAKLYAMFNLAQFQFRESRYILEEFANHEHLEKLDANFSLMERFARRLRAMPIWDRDLPWALLPHYRDRLDLIIKNIDADCLGLMKRRIDEFLRGNDQAISPLFEFQNLCAVSWEQFSAIGQTFEDIVREWFLPTCIGQLGSGEAATFRSIKSRAKAEE